MALYTKKLYFRKNDIVTAISLYDAVADLYGKGYIVLMDGSKVLYATIGDTTATGATALRVRKNGVVYAVLQNTIPNGTQEFTGSGTFIVPNGTYTLTIDLVGGGGGGAAIGGNGGAGGSSTFGSYLTAIGGKGGTSGSGSGSLGTGGVGGSGNNGGNGQSNGYGGYGGFGYGGTGGGKPGTGSTSDNSGDGNGKPGTTYGAGAGGASYCGGGGGGQLIYGATVNVTPGQSIAVTIGAGGAKGKQGTSAADGYQGNAGYCKICW